jgi:predicted ATP-grasp superfamily ATP-dependent carboligase
MRVLITGASTFFVPPLVRGFGLRGVEVTAADSRWFSMGKAARHSIRTLRLPLLAKDPGGYLDGVLRELAARPYDLLLPAHEESLLLGEYRRELEPLTRVFLPTFANMWRLHDKTTLYQACLDLGIPAPLTVIPANPAGIAEQVSGLRFPVVIKLPTANNCAGRVFCDNPAELTDRYSRLYEEESRRGNAPPFVQQKIEGEPIYTLMFCERGRKLGEVMYKPLRTYPERGGTSAHRESVEIPEIAELTGRLAQATEWSGFLGLDFIVNRDDGKPCLLDANPRATPGIQLGMLAGVDWPGMMIDLLENRPVEPRSARAGVRTRTFLLDAAWLLEGWAPQRHWLASAKQRLKKYRHPDWELTSRNEFLETGEWRCTLAMAYQGLSGMARSIVSGREIGQMIFDDLNYDTVTAERLRKSRSNAGKPSGTTPATG